MKTLANLWLLLTFLAWAGCGGDQSNQDGTGTDTTDTTDVSTTDTTTTEPTGTTKPNCPVAGKVLEGNEFWAENENLLVRIAAGEETQDKQFGESHRILQVYDGATCQQVMKEILPVNLSPDFPYYLSDITYNNVSKVLAIKGFDKILILDLANRKLQPAMSPKFLNQRYVEDAQSGMIQRLEVWENYMVGYAASMGTFAFDLRNPQKPEPVLPFAEYEVEQGTRYNSLFILKSLDENDGHQLFLPTYDAENELFKINPLFDKPRKMETNFNRKFKNNKYLVLKEFTGDPNGRPVAIDMSKMKVVDLPADVAAKKDTEIIEWMKKN
ncbi:MAG: hypothetical protein AAB316_07505 [Bacteroidota bacterium]